MKIIVIDIGGTHVKMSVTGYSEVRQFPSGPDMTPMRRMEEIKANVADWEYDVVSIGYPGPVLHNKPLLEPKHLSGGWIEFDFAGQFQKPVRIINDAAMQALGSY